LQRKQCGHHSQDEDPRLKAGRPLEHRKQVVRLARVLVQTR